MMAQTWTAPGIEPTQLYQQQFLTAPPNSARLSIARTLQSAIDANAIRTARYSWRLGLIVSLLAAGPILAAAIALAVIVEAGQSSAKAPPRMPDWQSYPYS
jgi:hypothetical protein